MSDPAAWPPDPTPPPIVVEPPPPPLAERAAGPFPAEPRVAFAIVAALAAAAFVAQALDLYAQGLPLSANVTIALALALAGALAAVAAFPGRAQRALGAGSRADLRRSAHMWALLFLTAMVFFALAVNALQSGVVAFERFVLQEAPREELTDVSPDALAVALLINLIVLVTPPLVWVAVVEGVSFRGALARLGLHGRNAAAAVGWGALAAVGVVGLLAVVLGAASAFVEFPENEVAVAIAESLNPWGALAVAAIAAVSEEVFFRGFLMPRIGLVPQAVLFGLAHLSYVHALELVVTFVLALAFGLLVRRTGSLWSAVVAHFGFNALMLLGAQFATA